MSDNKVVPAAPMRPEERINDYSAQQDDAMRVSTPIGEATVSEEPIEFGEMNEADAKASGYIGEDGRAVETAKQHDGTHIGADL